ncbi:MAG: alpha/beta hydrolase fold domain-containing protein [Phycisphaera sp.]|nr:alpha/beta hydrolase fold domain-containing protein [Phycisphaera sp.]
MKFTPRRTSIVCTACLLAGLASAAARAADDAPLNIPEPQPITPGAQVITLWPKGSPMLKAVEGYDKPETLHMYNGSKDRILHLENVHNPSIEVHLAPADKANGAAMIVVPGGGNKTLYVGPEGVDVADWLNGLGVHAFVERHRLRPYDSTVDALADTQQAIRIVRAHAKEWGIDPHRVGIMGFSAGGEQAAWVTVKFDEGDPKSDDPIARESCRPDFSVLVYPGWLMMDYDHVPKNAPPTFITCAGIGDKFHAKQSVEFYMALFNQNIPVEMHLYGRGGHGGSIGDRGGMPFGTWPKRFVEWANDLKLMDKKQ